MSGDEEYVADALFEQACLRETVGCNSQNEYVARAWRVRRTTGIPLGYEGLRRYIRLRSDLGAATLRGIKSAVLYVLRLARKDMPEEDAARLDRMLDGLESYKGIPRRIRGAPSPEQIRALIAAARDERSAEDAIALVVSHGIAARAFELAAVDVEDVDLTAEVVWVPRKGPRLRKVRQGAQVERIITTPEALEALQELVRIRKQGRLFPNLNARTLSEYVKNVAARKGWDADLWWSGIHNLRHGAAAERFAEGIRATRAVGSWRGADAEARYGRQARLGPKDRANLRLLRK